MTRKHVLPGIAIRTAPVYEDVKLYDVPCAQGEHRLRFIAMIPGNRPDLPRGRFCVRCPYQDRQR